MTKKAYSCKDCKYFRQGYDKFSTLPKNHVIDVCIQDKTVALFLNETTITMITHFGCRDYKPIPEPKPSYKDRVMAKYTTSGETQWETPWDGPGIIS